MEPTALHMGTSTIIPKLVHLLTQWYILYPLVGMLMWYIIFKRGKGRK